MSHYWSVPPEWTGETAVLLGGGPSIGSVNMGAIHRSGARVIATNDSFRLAPWADVLYFCDREWVEIRGREVRATFTGKYLVTLENEFAGVKRLRNTGERGLETDPAGLRTGNNSGYQAINLAYHFGASRILLCGFEMCVRGDQLHHFEGIRRQDAADFDNILRDQMLPCFDTLIEPLAGVEVINCTPGSRLTCWPCAPLSEALRG